MLEEIENCVEIKDIYGASSDFIRWQCLKMRKGSKVDRNDLFVEIDKHRKYYSSHRQLCKQEWQEFVKNVRNRRELYKQNTQRLNEESKDDRNEYQNEENTNDSLEILNSNAKNVIFEF